MDSAPDFIAGRHGRRVEYLHPKLEPVLRDTYGVILYQEQVMRVATDLAGFSMPQAEIIMRAMAKKQQAKMDQMKPLFLDGCVANGVPLRAAQEVFTRMDTFGPLWLQQVPLRRLRPGRLLDRLPQANYPPSSWPPSCTTQVAK